MAKNMISSIAWVSRGYALKNPIEFEMDEEEMQQLKKDPKVRKK